MSVDAVSVRPAPSAQLIQLCASIQVGLQKSAFPLMNDFMCDFPLKRMLLGHYVGLRRITSPLC